MKKSNWLEPYKRLKNGKYKMNLPLGYTRCKKSGKTKTCINKVAGVYQIKSKRTGKIVYVGHSKTQLLRTILRHFQTWNDREQERKVWPKMGYVVQFTVTTPRRAQILEAILVNDLRPRFNKDTLTGTRLTPADQKLFDRWRTQRALRKATLEEAPF